MWRAAAGRRVGASCPPRRGPRAVARPRVDAPQLLERFQRLIRVLLEHALEQLGHRPERDLTVEESCYRDLVGGIDRAQRGAPAPSGLERQVEGGMGAGLERRER